MKTPNVTVIIPNYNHGRYLKQRIDSVLQQTYRDFEVIILDDGSTDKSREIIDSYKGHPAIARIVYNDINSGSPFVQWKKGVEAASGQWIWIAESDDYADGRFLEMMIQGVANRDQVGLVYCDSKIVTDEEIQVKTFASLKNEKYKADRWSSDHVSHGIAELEDYILLDGIIHNTSAVLFKRDTLMKVYPFDIPLNYIGDKYTFVKVLSVSDMAYIKEPLNYYRDPFNTRHAGKHIYYFYEQFLLFDWVFRNLKGINRRKCLKAFQVNTRNSLIREWNAEKVSIYLKLFIVNPGLWARCMANNLIASFGGL